MCSAIPFLTTMAILANSFTLVAIALDRYIAVVRIVKTNWEPSGIVCIVLAATIWATAGGERFLCTRIRVNLFNII